MISRFSDPQGGFFDAPSDGDPLPIRPKDLQDNATPSGNALACEVLLKLAALGGPSDLSATWPSKPLHMVAEDAERYPMAFAHWLNAADFAFGGRTAIGDPLPARRQSPTRC